MGQTFGGYELVEFPGDIFQHLQSLGTLLAISHREVGSLVLLFNKHRDRTLVRTRSSPYHCQLAKWNFIVITFPFVCTMGYEILIKIILMVL